MSDVLGLFLPEASDHARRIDLLIGWFSLLAFALTAPVFVLTLVFAIRYRRGKPANREHAPDRNVWLEVSWSVIPFLLILAFFIMSARIFFDLHREPASALPVSVVAKQWMWKFQQPGGQREINELHLPLGQPVTLLMASQDVIHSFYVPALRIKQDVLPGRYTRLSFTPTRAGSYRLHCAEYCGSNHSVMGGQLHVLEPAAYQRWLQTADRSLTPAGAGRQLYRRLGCAACHDGGSAVAAPRLQGLYGRRVALADGGADVADEDYLRTAILRPNEAVAFGYRPVMPAYDRVLDEEQTAQLVAWIREGARP